MEGSEVVKLFKLNKLPHCKSTLNEQFVVLKNLTCHLVWWYQLQLDLQQIRCLDSMFSFDQFSKPINFMLAKSIWWWVTENECWLCWSIIFINTVCWLFKPHSRSWTVRSKGSCNLGIKDAIGTRIGRTDHVYHRVDMWFL